MPKSRVNWIIHGDKNTKFYHTFCSYFNDLFTKPEALLEDEMRSRIQSLNIPLFSDAHIKWLSRPFSLEEVRTTTFQIGPLKTPRIDGKHGIFYQRF